MHHEEEEMEEKKNRMKKRGNSRRSDRGFHAQMYLILRHTHILHRKRAGDGDKEEGEEEDDGETTIHADYRQIPIPCDA